MFVFYITELIGTRKSFVARSRYINLHVKELLTKHTRQFNHDL